MFNSVGLLIGNEYSANALTDVKSVMELAQPKGIQSLLRLNFQVKSMMLAFKAIPLPMKWFFNQ